jgi:hypothetical protein
MNTEQLLMSIGDIDPKYVENAESVAARSWQIINRKKKVFRKPLVAVIAVTIACLCFSTPALAANNPAAYEVLYSISPATAQFFKPVQKSCEDQGIKMEVLAAYAKGDTAEVYISFQDLTGSRVDETTDLFDSYSINCPFDNYATCQLVDFDGATGTAQFLISITTMEGGEIVKNKVTFTISRFLSGKNIYDGIPIELDLIGINENPDTILLQDEYDFSGSDVLDYHEGTDPTVLVPSSNNGFGVEGVSISGIGYIDGMFHIQTYFREVHKTDDHGYFYFKDKEGNDIQCTQIFTFDDIQDGMPVRYYEFVFDIPQSQIGEYSLYGDFWVGATLTEGFWQVTFPLERGD